MRNLTFAGESDCVFEAPALSAGGGCRCVPTGEVRRWWGAGAGVGGQQIKREVCVSGQAASLLLGVIHRHVAVKLAGNWTCKSLILRRGLFKWDSTRVQTPPVLSRVVCNARYYSLSRLFRLCYIFILKTRRS